MFNQKQAWDYLTPVLLYWMYVEIY